MVKYEHQDLLQTSLVIHELDPVKTDSPFQTTPEVYKAPLWLFH